MEPQQVKVQIELAFPGDPGLKRTVITCRWQEAPVLVADWIKQAVEEKEGRRQGQGWE
ncbi:MAG: hypothetical protein M3170_07910 [Candidatus Dormibacteraeota bacterium]|jgi:hypothetical protein|nr:hypothetical protein [Candidatus Dormibacteraeota bacterium]